LFQCLLLVAVHPAMLRLPLQPELRHAVCLFHQALEAGVGEWALFLGRVLRDFLPRSHPVPPGGWSGSGARHRRDGNSRSELALTL
jgi:hypothetical protein